MRVAAKEVRPGDWVHLGGRRRKVRERYDRPPHESDSGCFMRPDNVWLRLGKGEVVAVPAEELVDLER
jgi:hypothetical protein